MPSRLVRAPLVVAGAAMLLVAACSNGQGTPPGAESGRLPDPGIDSARMLADLRLLADDSMRGRRTGTAESAQARRFIEERFAAIGLATATGGASGRAQPFTFTTGDGVAVAGVNVIGLVRGRTTPDRYIVVTAHYDHVGVGRVVDGDSIYNGADDNASGTAALLALAAHFARQPARHSLLFVALDAEEMGLRGARAFVAAPPVPREAIVLNVNMDMVSLSAKGELYAAGAAKWPALRPALERVAARAPVRLLLGHDTPVPTPQDDWTSQSDHGVFHEAGIPFVYFGVEDHPHYHRPSDEPRNVTTGFYVNAVRTVLDAIRELDGR